MTDQDEFGFDDERGECQWDLTNLLQGTIDKWSQEREAYLREGPERGDAGLTWLAQNAELFGDAVLKATEDLVSANPVEGEYLNLLDEYYAHREKEMQRQRECLQKAPPDFRAHLAGEFGYRSLFDLEQDSPAKLVWEHLFIKLAWDSIDKIEEGSFRLMDLWGLVTRANPCPASVQFLRRVSRCYVWGFDTECIILCRSVLDTAFREVRPDERTLYDQIEAVARDGWIEPDVAKAAHRVRHRGKKAVHYEPDLPVNPLDVIRDTLTVLEAIAT